MKTDACLVIIPNPCRSVALDYRVEAKSLSTSHHSGVLVSSHEKQSVMKLRPEAMFYIYILYIKWGREGQAGSSLLRAWVSDRVIMATPIPADHQFTLATSVVLKGPAAPQ